MLLHHFAQTIVGPHGASFSACVFARRHECGLVELHPKIGNFGGGSVNSCHQVTAASADLVVQETDVVAPGAIWSRLFRQCHDRIGGRARHFAMAGAETTENTASGRNGSVLTCSRVLPI